MATHAHTEEYRSFTLIATIVSCAVYKDDKLAHSTANLHTGKEWVDSYWVAAEDAAS